MPLNYKSYQDIIEKRGITRLIHFTKSKNIPFIFGDFDDVKSGLWANEFIDRDDFHEKNDEQRYDNKEDYICTSVQYPNVYYLNSVLERQKQNEFNEWVILEIKPSVINDTTLFCPFNAATERGKHIRGGLKSFEDLFADNIVHPKRNLSRSPLQRDNTPTDNQAEVLIYKHVESKDIIGLIFANQDQLQTEMLRLNLIGIDLKGIDIKYSPDLFNKDSLIQNIRSGRDINSFSYGVNNNGK